MRYWVGLDCSCTPETAQPIGPGVMVRCPEHGPVYVNDGGHVVGVTLDCGCDFDILLSAVPDPTDEQVLEAITNPGITVGAVARRDEHGSQVVTAVS